MVGIYTSPGALLLLVSISAHRVHSLSKSRIHCVCQTIGVLLHRWAGRYQNSLSESHFNFLARDIRWFLSHGQSDSRWTTICKWGTSSSHHASRLLFEADADQPGGHGSSQQIAWCRNESLLGLWRTRRRRWTLGQLTSQYFSGSLYWCTWTRTLCLSASKLSWWSRCCQRKSDSKKCQMYRFQMWSMSSVSAV